MTEACQGMIMYFCETPLHAGAGDSRSHIDLPIQRDYRDFPIINAGGVKGGFRERAEKKLGDGKRLDIFKAFGPPPPKKKKKDDDPTPDQHGGALDISDAEILLFPVRSYQGLFAWITCPEIISDFCRRLDVLGFKPFETDIDAPEDTALVSAANINRIKREGQPDKIILEDIAFEAENEERGIIKHLAAYASAMLPSQSSYNHLRKTLENRIVILADDVFRDFAILSTEVTTRICIGEAGTVVEGPWSEEYLPLNTFLFGSIRAEQSEPIKTFTNSLGTDAVIQMGGNKTIGKGHVRVAYYPAPPDSARKE
ncbi:MAG: type III-B CRISPR module RAMP protein Cmr4 [Deltaproteobacteria bacterium]|nr:type III-B CRISPR module RAMP protein Cmr4 [Deltaproteobacteria bacterium]